MAKTRAELLVAIKQTGQKTLTGIKNSLSAVGKAAGVVAGAFVGLVAASLKAYREQELAVNKLNQSLAQQGIFSVELSRKYQDQAAALQKLTTFGDEQIISAQAQLQAYLGQKEVTQDLTKAVLDFSTAMGVDLKSAADLVGKTIGSSTNALSRYGISVDSGASSSEKLAQVTKALNDRFGGQAEAAAKGLGSLVQLKNVFGDVLEVIGKRFAPVVTNIAKELSTFGEKLQKDRNLLEGFALGFRFLGNSVISVKGIIKGLGEAIGTVLGAGLSAVIQTSKGQFTKAFETLKTGIAAIQEDAKTTSIETMEELVAFNQSFDEREIQRRLNNEDALNAGLDKKQKEQLKNTSKNRNTQIKLEQATQVKLQAMQVAAFKFKKFLDSEEVRNKQAVLGQIATLTQSNNKTLAALGKAAAIADITINTARGVSLALGTFPWPFSIVVAGLVGVAGAVQAAKVAGVQLAEGGIVRATEGGVQATIGEGGRDEAVIPLDSAGLSGVTININPGVIIATESQMKDLAIEIDKELLELRRGNQSLAFDGDVI